MSSPVQRLAPLREGERLSREEFELRYHAMPEVKKAELIDGVVHMPSPVSLHGHGVPHARLNTWLDTYAIYTPGTQCANNATVRLDLDNEPQPDLVLLIDPGHGGQASISADDFIEQAPELVVEVSSSTALMDLSRKAELYRRNGVREYLLWNVPQGAIEWFVLREGQFARLQADPEGIWRSEVFPGLWLDGAALIRQDGPTLLATLQQGLASPEHAAFVARLGETPGGPTPTLGSSTNPAT
jgi:Uma2 family endonuclease